MKYNEASAAMEDREEKILEITCEIEKDLDLLGRSEGKVYISHAILDSTMTHF